MNFYINLSNLNLTNHFRALFPLVLSNRKFISVSKAGKQAT
jgi:hypothetical protein